MTAGTTGAVVPIRWRDAALNPPRAHGVPAVTGAIRANPADFLVEERLGFEPDGGAAHVLLRVEKSDSNTLYVARRLGREAGCPVREVGFAGLKDRRAVAIQWFSVPARRTATAWEDCAGDGFRVLSAHPHSRKLRRGALAGNRFRILVRGVAGATEGLEGRIAEVAARGVPNYFGPQRFGRDGANLTRVLEWASGAPLPRDREARGFVLSTARSLCFNAVLGARVRATSWDQILDGELVNLSGSASLFAATAVDGTLRRRCLAFDLHPTGPLPGRDGLVPGGAAIEVERAALAGFAAVVDRLADAGVDAGRRALRLRPDELRGSLSGEALELSFALPPGAFATAVLREIVAVAADAPGADGD